MGTPLKSGDFALFACLASKGLQIGTDVLLIITSTDNAVNISDLE